MRRTFLGSLLVGLLITASGCGHPGFPPPSAAHGPQAVARIPWLPPSVARFGPLIDATARRHGVDPALVAIVVLVESGGDPMAESPAGAKGLMQLMPATAAEVAERRGLPFDESMLFRPEVNVELGVTYLAAQIRRFWTTYPDETVARAAGAYNGGPGRMRRHLEEGEALYDETISYRKWVVGMWRERYAARSMTFEQWWFKGGRRLVAGAAPPPSTLAWR